MYPTYKTKVPPCIRAVGEAIINHGSGSQTKGTDGKTNAEIYSSSKDTKPISTSGTRSSGSNKK
jgi:hypothetical protein